MRWQKKTFSKCAMFPWTKIPELGGLNGSCFLGSVQILQYLPLKHG